MCPIFVGRIDLYLLGIVLLAEEAHLLNVIFSELFAQVFMSFHADRGELSPKGIIGVIVVVQVVSGTVPEHADHLLQSTINRGH